MLRLHVIESNIFVSEQDLYVPVEKAAFILTYGITGSGHDVVARALSYYAPNSRDWKALERFAQDSAALACAGLSSRVVVQSPDPVSWYLGELGDGQNAAAELDSLVNMLRSGSQVIAYVHATDPLPRLRTIYRDCEPDKLSLLENLITERKSRVIEVVRRTHGGVVQVKPMSYLPKVP